MTSHRDEKTAQMVLDDFRQRLASSDQHDVESSSSSFGPCFKSSNVFATTISIWRATLGGSQHSTFRQPAGTLFAAASTRCTIPCTRCRVVPKRSAAKDWLSPSTRTALAIAIVSEANR